MGHMPARDGDILVWKHSALKGAVLLTVPSGEVCCQGNQEQQQLFYDILIEFTDPWDQPMEMTKGGRQKMVADSLSAAPRQITAAPKPKRSFEAGGSFGN